MKSGDVAGDDLLVRQIRPLKPYAAGSTSVASRSIVAIAWPELTPGAVSPLISAAGYMLYRTTRSGPVVRRISTNRAKRHHGPGGRYAS